MAVCTISAPPKLTEVPITFSAHDASGVNFPHNDALVISTSIAGYDVKRVLVDGGSSADLLFIDAFDKMMIPRDRLRPAAAPLQGFGGEPLEALGQINLPVIFGDTNRRTQARYVTFDVVDIPYQYNVVLGKGTLNAFGAIPHHNYLSLKMIGPEGVVTIRGDQDLVRRLELHTTNPKQAASPQAGESGHASHHHHHDPHTASPRRFPLGLPDAARSFTAPASRE